MADRLNSELIQVKADLRRKNKWQKQVKDYETELAEIEGIIKNLTKRLREEEKDVEKLEGFSISSLFQTLKGNKEEQIEKEKQEVVAVQLELQEAQKTKKELDQALTDLQHQLEKIGNVDAKYQQLITEKEQYIKQSNNSTAATLYELVEQEGDVKAYIVELNEAIRAGSYVAEDLESASASLDSAANWGAFDMFGGGAISGIAKHGHIDDATAAIHKAQTSMRRFQKELLDVQEELDVQIDISGMLKFADFFLDGFFVDFMVQNKINEARDQVSYKQDEVERILRGLNKEVEANQEKIVQIGQERQRVIEDY
ncbi:hypothetical protein [Oceanobacillus manasiensis]|uniref:hypothetical protein n=1 Tax=Oceanobacillus manasiensis TaxID=586413 RepID=UPI0005AB5648|nr:hypothetical protein [Oceanobacillus manasiensis]